VPWDGRTTATTNAEWTGFKDSDRTTAVRKTEAVANPSSGSFGFIEEGIPKAFLE
jgi:hypothetical protein